MFESNVSLDTCASLCRLPVTAGSIVTTIVIAGSPPAGDDSADKIREFMRMVRLSRVEGLKNGRME